MFQSKFLVFFFLVSLTPSFCPLHLKKQQLHHSHLYQFSISVVTNQYKLGDLKQDTFVTSQPVSQKNRMAHHLKFTKWKSRCWPAVLIKRPWDESASKLIEMAGEIQSPQLVGRILLISYWLSTGGCSYLVYHTI